MAAVYRRSRAFLRFPRVTLTFLVLGAVIGQLAPSTAGAAPSFTFRGRGWGHGVGMSQWGARGLAEQGWNAGKILGWYYRGTRLERKPTSLEVRVGLLQEQSSISISGDGRFDLFDRTGARRASGAAGETWRVVPSRGKLFVHSPRGGDAVFSSSRCSAKWCEQFHGLDSRQVPVIHMGIDTRLFRLCEARSCDA